MIEKDPDAGGRYVVIDDWPHLFVADRRTFDRFKLKDLEAVVADNEKREIGGQVRVRADLARDFHQFEEFTRRAAAAMQGEMMREFFLLYRGSDMDQQEEKGPEVPAQESGSARLGLGPSHPLFSRRPAFDVEHIFTYHAPSREQQHAYAVIRASAQVFATALLDLTPRGADQSAVVRKLRECVMTANAAIALGGRLEPLAIGIEPLTSAEVAARVDAAPRAADSVAVREVEAVAESPAPEPPTPVA